MKTLNMEGASPREESLSSVLICTTVHATKTDRTTGFSWKWQG